MTERRSHLKNNRKIGLMSGTGNPRRGAAFLLSIYLVSLSLLILSGVALQRCTTELRAAQVSRDQSQRFFLAEGALHQAVADLRAGRQPALGANGCGTSATLSGPITTGQSSYQLCQLQQGNPTTRYRIASTGTLAGLSRSLTTTLDFTTAQELRFDHAAYAQYIAWVNATSGGTNTESPIVPMNPPQNTTNRGDLAVGALLPGASFGVVIINSPQLPGTIFVDPNMTPPDLYVALMNTPDPTGGIRSLAPSDVKTLPTVVVPPTAKELGTIEITTPAENRCLSAGTYVADEIFIYDAQSAMTYVSKPYTNPTQPELCTTGPVDLYVRGPVTVVGGKLYGQPTGTAPNSRRYKPENLRLFYGESNGPNYIDGSGYRTISGSLVAAGIYAPQTTVTLMGSSLLLGGVIAKTVYGVGAFAMAAGGITVNPYPTFLFDEALRNKKFRRDGWGTIRAWIDDGS